MQLEMNEVSENSNETQDMETDEASNKIQNIDYIWRDFNELYQLSN